MDFSMKVWSILWQSDNKLNGKREGLVRRPGQSSPVLFQSRQNARNFINRQYGYIRGRPDLRAEPHGWKMPHAVKVVVDIRREG